MNFHLSTSPRVSPLHSSTSEGKRYDCHPIQALRFGSQRLPRLSSRKFHILFTLDHHSHVCFFRILCGKINFSLNIWKLRYGRNAHAIDPNAGLSPSSKTWNPTQQAAWVTIFDLKNSFQVSSAKSCLLARSHATLSAGESFIQPSNPSNGCFFWSDVLAGLGL